MKNQAYRMAMLFDFYGDLLTERQREFYDLYYNEDLSLAAIAAIDQAADQLLQAVNERSYNDAMLDGLANTIKENAAKLNQE